MKTKILLSITAVILLFPKTNFGQAPNLGTAVNFELFTTNGAITNSGISQITGNVGSNIGSSTNFGNVNGGMHDQDGVSGQCATDLQLAYNQLNSAIPTGSLAPLLGNGQTLFAGVYAIAGATTQSLDLILDAQGNANAVFIFQISGTFSTGANAKVKLINGAQACNVFWKVEGMVSMAAGTTMRGTVIANNAAISMNTGDTLEGRALSIAGAIGVSGVLAYAPIGCGSTFLTGPTAPALATTECYAVFSSDGPVANGDTVTVIKGDIGTNVGLTTNYDTLKVTGKDHLIPDGSTAQCAADLLNVFTYLNTLTPDIELLYPPQFGNNLVLTPHTYVMNGAVTFTDTLYLNAQGNANAIFVIQVFGAFATSTYSKVILLNGAQAKNVYWDINGAVSINNYSIFNGTIIANNGAINLTRGVILNGRAMSTTGAVHTVADTITEPNSIQSVGMVTGITTVCQAQTGVSYSVSPVINATNYSWTLPAGAIITAGANTNSITLNFGASATSGTITVKASNNCGPGLVSANFLVTVNPLPTMAGPITGTVVVCQGQTGIIYSVPVITTATNYIWTLPTGLTITTGNNTNSITVNFGTSAMSGTITSQGNNGCGTGSVSANYTITVNPLPAMAGPITGTATPCQGQTGITYSVSAITNATGYIWTLPTGAIVATGVNTNSITVNFSGSAASGVITAQGDNGCGDGIVSANFTVTVCHSIGIASMDATNTTAAIYPNPFTASVFINIADVLQINNCEVRIYNVLGAEVMNIPVTKQLTTLETSSFSSGIYFYKIIDKANKVIQSGKLIAQQ